MLTPTIYRIPAHRSGECLKALYLYATGVTPSDTPDATALNRMEAGRAMKPAVAAALRREGWQTRLPPPMPDIAVTDTLRVSVAGDLVMAHDEITGGEWIAVVMMSAKEKNVSQWLINTTAKAYPRQLRSLALATEALRLHPEPQPEIDAEQPQMAVMLDRDNGTLEYEPNDTEYLERIAQQVKERLKQLDSALQSGQMPEAEYTPESRACRRCPYLTACHGAQQPPAMADGSDPVTEEQFLAAVEQFYTAELQLLPLKSVTRQRDDAKTVIKRYMTQADVSKMPLQAETARWDAAIRTSKRTALSLSEARKRLTPEQLADIATNSVQTALYITPAE